MKVTRTEAQRFISESNSIEDIRRVAIEAESNPRNEKYLRTKVEKLGHVIDGLEPGGDGEGDGA